MVTEFFFFEQVSVLLLDIIAVFSIHFTVKAFNQLYITNRMEHFSFKSGCTVYVVKLIKIDCMHLATCSPHPAR